MEKRSLSFAGSTVVIEYEGPLAGSIVEFLFQGMPHPATPPAVEPTTFSLTPGEGPDRLRLLRDGVMLHEGFGRGVAADMLLAWTSRDLAEKSSGGMLFHAGALAWRDGLIILPAGIGDGKSTFTLWLTLRGLGYLSDEAVFVPEGSERALPFRRPLNLTRSSRELMESLFGFDEKTGQILASSDSDLIHPSALTPGPEDEALPVRLILFPRYRPGTDLSWEPLTTARTGQELMQCLVNARNLPEHGFPEAVRLAKEAKGYKIVYSDFDQIAEQVEELLDLPKEHNLRGE